MKTSRPHNLRFILAVTLALTGLGAGVWALPRLSVAPRLAMAIAPEKPSLPDSFVLPHVLEVLDGLRGWRQGPAEPLRADPFAYVRPAASGSASTNREAVVEGAWVLTGISINGGQAFAVVNRTVVAVGDEVGSCRVERIGRDEVVLAGPRGPVRLRLDRGAVAEDNAPLAALVDADDSSGGGRLRGSAGPARVRESP